MTESTIKDQLAKFHFGVLASRAGCKVISYNYDDGSDIGIDEPYVYNSEKSFRHTSKGNLIEFQLKTTTENGVIISERSLKYDIDNKNLNDLVHRRRLFSESNARVPLALGLLVLPSESKRWVNVKSDSTVIYGSFYWYYPHASMDLSGNKSTRRIEIPLENKIGLSFFEEIYKLRNNSFL